MDPNEVSEGLTAAVETAGGLIIEYGMSVIGAIVLFIVGRIIAGWSRSRLTKVLTKAGTDLSLVPFFASMLYYLILGVVLVAVLNLFGIETTSLIAVFASAGLAVGLALQGTLSNFAAGVMLLVFRPIRVGDFVEVAGQAGTVKEIAIFNTIMHTGDNVRIVIPNGAIYGDVVKNYSYNDTRRIDLVMGIGYGDDIGQAIQIIERVVTGDSRTLTDPAPVIAVAELGDSSVNLVVRPWCNASDYWALRWNLTRKLKEELEAGGCNIPYPQSDVHIVEMPSS
ncbi:MAG: mechanosensitive ion channel [Myxococcota bacterium]|jgi:small conductance mechanosensitive channel